VPGNDAFSRDAQQLLEISEKAANAPVKHRNMLYEKQIAGEKG
jgi:hypothetical protein